jgi:hypothetical protein
MWNAVKIAVALTLHARVTPYLLVFACGVGVGIWHPWHQAMPVIIHDPGTTTVVPGPDLSAAQLVAWAQDKAEMAKLAAENKALKITVSHYIESTGTHTSTGGGPLLPPLPVTSPVQTVTPPVPTSPCPAAMPCPPQAPVRFRDWRLDFTAENGQARYALHQTFEILASVGTTKAGKPAVAVRLFEVGPGEAKTAIPVTTSVLAADPLVPHWMARLRLQGGLGVAWTTAGVQTLGGVVAAQWLAHGRSLDVKDTRYAVLSPAVLFTSKELAVGLLPVSLNVGSYLKPFTNVWLSPFVGAKVVKALPASLAGMSWMVGLAVSATF